MTAAGRREAILKVLEVRRFETRTNLAFEFGVSERTIENDIRLLMERYPIYTKPGYRGGIGVVEGATLVGKRMSLEETNFLEKMKSSTNEHGKAILSRIIKNFGCIHREG